MRKYKLKINEKELSVQVKTFSAKQATLDVDGKEVKVDLSSVESLVSKVAPRKPVAHAVPSVAAPPPVAATGSGVITAPIPGAIMEVFVKVGDKVTPGMPVLKMEAMKMENEVKATSEGTIQNIKVGTGDSVNQGQELMVIV